jgi:2-oxoglutarate ferredoxin oxidoreductase subunit alpha
MDADLNIRITGGAGQGVHTVGSLIARMAVSWGYHFHATQDYMSRIRGGRNSYAVRIGSGPIRAGREEADILLVLDPGHLSHFAKTLAPGGIVLAEAPSGPAPAVSVPLKALAAEAGSPILANVVGAGVVACALGIPPEFVEPILAADFRGDFLDKNRKALALGAGWARTNIGPRDRKSVV